MTKTLIGALALVLVPRAALASVSIDATRISWPDLVLASAGQDFLHDVSEGDYDDLCVRIPVTDATHRLPAETLSIEDGHELLEVSARSFAVLPDEIRQHVAAQVVKASYSAERVPIYRARVELTPNAGALGGTRLVHLLGTLVPGAEMVGEVDASDLLGDFARAWAYRDSGKSGPNCWDSAIASTAPHWLRPRYMGPEEFVCQLENYYQRVPEGENDLSQLEFGDVVRLVDDDGAEVHGFVFLGPDREQPDRYIVFTKNGYRRGYYLYQDYETVTGTVYPGTHASYYRAARPVPDPDSDEGSVCGGQGAIRAAAAPRRDPIVTAGLRALGALPAELPATRLAPVEIE